MDEFGVFTQTEASCKDYLKRMIKEKTLAKTLEELQTSIRYIDEFLGVIGLKDSNIFDKDYHERLKAEGEKDKMQFCQFKL